MKKILSKNKISIIFSFSILLSQKNYNVDYSVIAKFREEGFQRSEISSTLSYMTDVLGARLTNSEDMRRAQDWAAKEMRRIGLKNVNKEPFMDYGYSWDNLFFSLHLLEPDYQPMVGYPIAHTPGTDGKKQLSVVLADIKTKDDFLKYKGLLKGKAVLASSMVAINMDRYNKGVSRYSEDELIIIQNNSLPKKKRINNRIVNPSVISSEERNTFFKR